MTYRHLKILLPAFVIMIALVNLAPARAQVPQTLNYQGFLANSAGQPVNVPANITFRLYASAGDATPLWQETQNGLGVTNGVFNAVLGKVTPLGLAFNVPYFLGVQVNGDAEMTPRQPLTSSPYAFRAAALDGTATVTTSQLTGTLANGQFAATQLLPIAPCVQNQVPQWSGTGWICGDAAGGVNASLTGNLTLVNSTATTGNIMKGSNRFIHNTGTRNTFVGERAGNGSMTGFANAGFGYATLGFSTSGSNNTALGSESLFFNTSGGDNTAIGSNVLGSNTSGNANTGIGASALRLNTTGIQNTVSGRNALTANTTGSSNTASGVAVLQRNTTGSSNTAIGTSAMGSNTTGGLNTALGENALFSNTVGFRNTAIGFQAGINLTSGDSNILINHDGVATESNTLRIGTIGGITRAFVAGVRGVTPALTSLQPVVIDSDGQLGTLAAFPTPTIDSVTNLTLPASTASAGNIIKGTNRFIHNFGTNNTFVGENAGNLNAALTGTNNTASGAAALQANTTGSGNTAIGTNALQNNTIGSDNIAVGINAGSLASFGNSNIYVGNAGEASESNTIRIGTANVTSGQSRAFIAGVRGTNNIFDAINVTVDSSGQLGTIFSSRRVKDNITDMGQASSALMSLRPVTFHYKADQNPAGRSLQYGLIAEEVAEVYPGLVTRSADGQIETVLYQFLPSMLLNEVQKQQRTIDLQAEKIRQLEGALAAIQTRLETR